MKKLYIVALLFTNLIFANECGVFNNILQTRKPLSVIKVKGDGYIYNAPGCGLYTHKIEKENKGDLHCKGGSAYALDKYGKSIDESIFKWEFENSTASEKVGGGKSVTIETENQILTDTKYTKIIQDWHHYDFTWAPSGNNPEVKKIGESWGNLIGTVTIDNVANKEVKIGQFITAQWSKTSLVFKEAPKILKVGKLVSWGSNEFNGSFEATDLIEITEFDITSSANNTITLKAPVIKIAKENKNKMDLNNDNNHIIIYADKLYIGEIDFGERNRLEIHPYTPGKKVEVYIRQINFSSDSRILMDSGNYYIRDFNVNLGSGGVGSDEVVLMKASDENQIVNVIIDPLKEGHGLKINNVFGINSDGLGEIGSYNPANFRIFVGGNVDFGEGKSTINALVYSTGSVKIGSDNYIRGAISSYNNIEIADKAKFYWDDRINDIETGPCKGVMYQNVYVCGIFNTPLTTYKTLNITSNGESNIPRANSYSHKISYNNLKGKIYCNNMCGSLDNGTCKVIEPPKNKLTYKFPNNEKANINEDSLDELTDLYYGNFNFENKNVYFNPSNSYSDNDTKVMVIGDVNANSSTLTFEAGDYYFNNLILGNNSKIKLAGSGIVRIFIKNDFNLTKNNIQINSDGNAKHLFIYVGNNFNVLGKGGGKGSAINAFIYVKNNASFSNHSKNFVITGALTAEGDINIDGKVEFCYGGNPEELGYGKCPLCYALNNNNEWVSKIRFFDSTVTFNFPRKMAIINNSGKTLHNTTVTQEEIYPTWISTINPESYAIKDENDNIVKKHIENITKYKISDIGEMILKSESDNGKVTRPTPAGAVFTEINTTADYGDYGSGGYNNYYSIDTYGISGEFHGGENLKYYVSYYDDLGRFYNIQLDYCDIGNSIVNHIIGLFDAYEKNLTDRNITTKIVNQPFKLTLVSFNNKTPKKTVNVKYSLFNNDTRITEWKDFNTTQQPKKEVIFNINSAEKNVSVVFKVCSLYNIITKTYEYFDYKKCESAPPYNRICNSTEPGLCYRYIYSSDNFAIRPYAFMVFGNNQYKKAGENFNIIIKAVDESNYSLTKHHLTVDDINAIKDYNASLNNLNINSKFYIPTNDEVRQMNKDVYGIDDTNRSRVAYCPNTGVFSIIGNPTFNNGEVNATLKFSESGILEINVSEKAGYEFAKVDEKDTPASQRYIKSATLIYDVNDINKTDLLMFIPYKFITVGDYLTTINSNWVYMSNDVNRSNITFQMPKMAAYIKYEIRAYGKNNNLLKNYTKTCFPDITANAPNKNGLKLNTTFDLFLDADIESTKNTIISVFVTDNNNNSIWTPNKKMKLRKGKNSFREWIAQTQFKEGIGIAKVFFNIYKNYSHPINEINITLNDINTSTSWMNNQWATNKFIGSYINKTIKFLYGRIEVINVLAERKEANTIAYYEYWDDVKGWVINKKHNGYIYGDINETKTKKFLPSGISEFNLGKIQNGEQNITIKTNHVLPYETKIHLSIDSWLWYHPLAKPYKDPNKTNLDCLTHPCMNVEFKKYSKGWGGAGVNNPKYKETNRTVKINSSSKIKANKTQIERLNW